MSNMPKLNKDCYQKIVMLKHTITNKGGQCFPEGSLMVVTKRYKKESRLYLRPLLGSIIVDESDVDFIGSKEECGFKNNQ